MEKYSSRKLVMRHLYATVCTEIFELTVVNKISEEEKVVKELRNIVKELDEEFDFANE